MLPKSPLGQAMTYALNQWTALGRYYDDGDLSIDNNASERALRAVAIGRKNWLFAGSDADGRRIARSYWHLQTPPLLHHVKIEQLRNSFHALKRDAAAGVDGLTWRQYQMELDERLTDLH